MSPMKWQDTHTHTHPKTGMCVCVLCTGAANRPAIGCLAAAKMGVSDWKDGLEGSWARPAMLERLYRDTLLGSFFDSVSVLVDAGISAHTHCAERSVCSLPLKREVGGRDRRARISPLPLPVPIPGKERHTPKKVGGVSRAIEEGVPLLKSCAPKGHAWQTVERVQSAIQPWTDIPGISSLRAEFQCRRRGASSRVLNERRQALIIAPVC